jgi:hypothetical protein
MSRERGRSERQGRSGNRRAWGPPPRRYGLPGAGEGIASFEDNQDDVRLTVTAKLVVRVTRPEILRQYAADAQRVVAEVHRPGDFGEFGYIAVTSESLVCGDAPYPKHDGGRWRAPAWPCGSRPSSPTIGCHASEPDEL